jgi:hypothetical protein
VTRTATKRDIAPGRRSVARHARTGVIQPAARYGATLPRNTVDVTAAGGDPPHMSASTAQAKQPPPAQSEPPPAPDPVVAMWQDLRAEDVVTRAGCALSPQDEQRLDAVIADAAGVWRAQFDGDPFWRHIAVVFAVAFSLALATVSAIVVVAWNRSAWWMLLVPAAHAVGWIVGNQLLAVYARIRYGAWSLSDFGEGDTAAVYTTAKWVGISTGLAAALYVVLAPYPGSPEGFFVAAMLVPVTIVLAFPIGLPLKVAFDSVRRLLRPANDPFPLFVCTLVQTLWTLRPSVRDTAPDAHPLPPPGLRSAGALSLDQAATRIELDLERSIPHGGPLAQVLARVGLPAPDDIGRLARQGVADRGRRIAAWLRDRETELLMPAPAGRAIAEGKIVRGLVGVCLDDPATCEADVVVSRTRSVLRRLLPRAGVAAVLGLAAWLAPDLLGEEATGLQVGLALSAASALATPATAWASAVKDTQEAVRRLAS